ncbi:hypothetical protein FS842_000676, partial [Serendipita sp. 407]
IAASAVEEKARTGAVNWKDAVTPSSLSVRLEDPSRHAGWPCPDLLLIHTPATSRKAQLSPLEFEGFPPWQIHLTEIAYESPAVLDALKGLTTTQLYATSKAPDRCPEVVLADS